MESDTKTCVVCGLGSSRSDWQSQDNPACDGHTKEEIKAALEKIASEAKSKLKATVAELKPAQSTAGSDAKVPPTAPPAPSTDTKS